MKKDIPIDELAPLLEKDKGNVAAVARRFGVSRGTILNRVNESPTLQKVLADARESMLDNAESVLYKKVLEGSTAELIFFLKTQGKSRGYVERQELTGADGDAIRFTADDAAKAKRELSEWQEKKSSG
jgi:hypothetical protein